MAVAVQDEVLSSRESASIFSYADWAGMSSGVKLKPLTKNLKALDAELVLLDTLLYRSKNQYRGFPFYRKCCEVNKAALRMQNDYGALLAKLMPL